MKKILLTIVALFSILALSSVSSFAVTITPSPTDAKISPTIAPNSVDESQIEKIKDLVASRVAELKLVDKKGILGTVKNSTNTQINLTNHKNLEASIDIDELTKFQTDNDKSFGISDIKKGDVLSIIGLYNKETKRLLARFVERATSIPENIEGVVAGKDTRNFTMDIVGVDEKTKIVDVQSSTKTTSYDKGVSTKSGFSKITVGERIIIVGFADPKIENQINTSRIIHFPNLPPSRKLINALNISKEKTPVSTGSAGKLQPITR